MGQAGLQGSCPHNKAVSRLLIEKPFGYDLASARKLLAAVCSTIAGLPLARYQRLRSLIHAFCSRTHDGLTQLNSPKEL